MAARRRATHRRGVIFALSCLALLLGSGACVRRSASAPVSPEDAAGSVQDWARRCEERLEATRVATLPEVPALARASVAIDPSPWNPTLRFEAHGDGGYYEGAVTHGHDPCRDFDSDDPALSTHPWRDGAHVDRVALHRLRRLQGDEAWIEADGVPAEAVEAFRRAFEPAFEACLQDARSVPVADAPPTVSCLDSQDRCPDEGEPAADDGVDDGCPPPAPEAPAS